MGLLCVKSQKVGVNLHVYLPQYSLEVPYTLKFQGSTKDIDKIKKRLEDALHLKSALVPPINKRMKLDSTDIEEEAQGWVWRNLLKYKGQGNHC